ncbi:MAG: peroxiredoxin [Gemmatimonadetes bacterium 13_1_20CM_69_28]|nr:MAG: peroxiredoxin [Gemmatimonadetes bacterium 13_1_20CM_69_28]PYO31901.1 MAG: peroxiredoxin [Gemmatimonadota bacterium]PYP26917.1 MAG: peroxiredoxin [Gemmatimonadota bacterium]
MEPVSVRKEKKVRVGDRAPDFTLPDQTGKPVQLRDLLGRGTVVLYFYPKDETPGCTLEARAFRDSYDRFTARGAEVVGISSDSVAAHRRFAARHGLPFLLLSDRGASVRELYGVEKTLGFLPGRVTYVIDQAGVVRHTYSSQVRATRHSRVALEALAALTEAVF